MSKTTIIAFLAGEAWMLMKDESTPRRSKIILVFATAAVAVAFSGLYVAYFDIYTGYGNQAETLTGRVAIWAWALEHGLERPWLGHGFDSMWKVAPVFGTFEARHAENEVLQQFYTLGVAGVVMMTACYLSLWKEIQNACQESRRMILSSTLIFVIVRGLAEAEPFDLLLPLWMIALLTTVVSAPGKSQTRVPVGLAEAN